MIVYNHIYSIANDILDILWRQILNEIRWDIKDDPRRIEFDSGTIIKQPKRHFLNTKSLGEKLHFFQSTDKDASVRLLNSIRHITVDNIGV